ncbi:uncharacterized protein LOC110231017 [Arabidopsis lyrata subsp. lyrata]|uniref:uncharacterized protein LOC9308321 n=1 Tax=Arabidopsis lyrata subsp. lyrata TaxID=81972 RepID=UPI000A29D3C9|nr:uncharacterized protein LOC9308321 [Arabidopsis lyrata subsp. lyrata]XP_002874430.2 uncharacterized protein LOC9308387 [Arabidopsis lyrata subsp. lyrata]XP_020871251.1 uncharacterized protein LOC9301989 [Arabidopsis lyrata subsp. lyrata]XP_020891275.1 uncharacterized protein LOC110231017 [Arabidopsis lyrata subsp. lyrata]|eukprot:XP_002874336.2 uncharacterized protein LOC9308321 [Arabidopsis lyrata subsp. lyrata]
MLQTPETGIKTKESYEVNSRGVEIFSKSWLPEASRPRALVCFCHGYGDTCTFFFEGIARRLALSGYGVFAMDPETKSLKVVSPFCEFTMFRFTMEVEENYNGSGKV